MTSKVNKNSMNTSIYWLHKVFLVLRNWQNDTILKGDIKTKDGKKLRGISHNQHCIGIGYDKRNVIAIVEGLRKTSTERTDKAFESHIEIGSKLIHDDEKAHHKLVKNLKLIDENYKSLWLKTKKDKDNPLRSINHQCDLIRQFLNTYSGFDRDNLQDYLNLYCFMNSGHKNKLEKVNDFIELALKSKASLSYRDLFDSKTEK